MLAPNSLLQNRYRIVRQLGSGGMGTVYEAIDQRVNCLVAVKETAGVTDEARRAFEREASLLANLRHSGLPRVMDHFGENNSQFLVMDFIAGHDLGELLKLRGRPLEIDEVLRFADTILGVLEYLHGRQPPVLHRDIKPANLKLTDDGQLYLIDFGLAKGAAGEMPASMQTSRSVVGYTPVYSSLEQIYGQGTDPRSDLYAVAATLYHLMTGVVPIDAPTRFMAVDEDRPDPMLNAPAWTAHPNSNVVRVVTRGLALRRKERIETAAEFRRELNEAVAADRSMRSAQTVILNDRSFNTTPPSPRDPAPTVSSQDVPYSAGGQYVPVTTPLGQSSGTGGGGPVGFYGANVSASNSGAHQQTKPRRSRAKWVVLSLLAVLLLAGGAFAYVYAFYWDELWGPTTPQPLAVAPPTPEPYRGPKIELVQLSAGSFTMGSPAAEPRSEADENYQHQVTFSKDFYLGKYEVTQTEWEAVMGSNPSGFKDCPRCPVELVSWDDVQTFITKLNALGGPYVYRLPTEAEWEYGCRAGTTTPFAFGNYISSDQANFKASEEPYETTTTGEYRAKPTPVGTFSPNAWGLYDMHGNVMEWVADWYDSKYYESSPSTDPTGPTSGAKRVLRGGAWSSPGRFLRSAYRNLDETVKKYNNCGFRLAATKRSS